MKLIIYIAFLSSAFLLGCNYSYNPPSKRKAEALNNYLQYKRGFDSWLVKHFPSSLKSEITQSVSNKDDFKNDIGLYLYEYDVDLSRLQHLKDKVERNALAYYHVTDSLIFVVNRFETLQTDYNGNVPKIKDSLYIDSATFIGLYPVPNFIGYQKPISTKNGIWLPKGFDLYVLEAKSGDYCTEFELKENFQMPKGWKNGFSRGVAINEKDRTVIYWGIIW